MSAGFTLNGAPAAAEAQEGESLLHLLRGALALSGPRFGCGAEQCGACCVLVDGAPAHACTLPAEAVAGRSVVTVEGLAEHPIVAALIAEAAGQCGFCLSGIGCALVDGGGATDEAAIREALAPHLCRCGAHNRILRAVARASDARRAQRPARAPEG
jgi:nicotinate dehydrogenase subunit A